LKGEIMKKYKCIMKYFRWKKSSNPLSWISITSPTGKEVLINIKLHREIPLSKENVVFLEKLAKGDEWPKKNVVEYSKETLKRFLDISEISLN